MTDSREYLRNKCEETSEWGMGHQWYGGWVRGEGDISDISGVG